MLLFTLSVIDEIQAETGLELFDAMQHVVKASALNLDKETRENYTKIVRALLNDTGKDYSEKDVKRMLSMENYQRVAIAIMQAFGLSIPEQDDDDDDDEDGDDSPKAQAGE